MYKKSIFIFRRSFRLDDNTGLLQALKKSTKVIPIFIFTPEQVVKNPYKSNTCVQFMIESLNDLNKQLNNKQSRLFYFFGKPEKIIKKIITSEKIEAVFVNADYTGYAKKRDYKIKNVCKKYKIAFHDYQDILLNPVGTVVKKNRTPFVKFTPFFNHAKTRKIQTPKKNNYKNYLNKKEKIKGEFIKNFEIFFKRSKKPIIIGGRQNAKKILSQIKNFTPYNKLRNNINYNTTQLSAYIKFGCISIREVFYAFKKNLKHTNQLFRQLYWRDFYYHISHFFPHIYDGPMKQKYKKIAWSHNETLFKKWCTAKTGFPIIDACMKQLNETGYINNRARLLVSSFLVKILLSNWRKGEKYFATKLIDYDPAVNNGNWQWVAGSGSDSQPYFRILNPWIQSKKFDLHCDHVKTWIPEIADVKNQHIHQWDQHYKKYKKIKYPKPMVDYKKQKIKTLHAYKQIF